jgi:predicted Zn-dependent protease with MMP-like domain
MRFQGDLDAPLSHLLQLAGEEIRLARAALPQPLQASLARVAIVLEEFPSPEFLQDGVDADQLGLFEGANATDLDSPQVPRIMLWLGNLWEMSEADEAQYREEVRVTFLHELGHYLGLDEDDIAARELD